MTNAAPWGTIKHTLDIGGMRVLQWKTCLRAGVTVALVYLAIHYWGPVSAALGVLLGAAWPLLLGAGIA